MIVIVPDVLRNTIDKKLDDAIKEVPEAAKDRSELFDQLLNYYDEYGMVPDFTLVRK